MRMSDVLACEVHTHDGTSLGPVRDVRLVIDGLVGTGAYAAMRVDALIVGGSALAGRLGYLRGEVRGPAPIAAVMRRLEQRAYTIPAGDVEVWALDDHVLRLTASAGTPRRGDPDSAG
jgi:hypothetical protein